MKKTLILLASLLATVLALTSCGGKVEASINGTSLSDYVIVYSESEPEYNKTAAEYIAAAILEKTGAELEVITDDEKVRKHEILVGETNRALSAALDESTDGLEFATIADPENVAIEGDYFVIAAAAYHFVDTYIKDASFAAEIPLDAEINEPIQEAPKNFIFLIGDGMGVYQTKLFDYLDVPASFESDGEDLFYGYMLPYRGESHTDSLTSPDTGEATDSAAGGTALATGYKTYNGYVGINKDKESVMSLAELAASLGKASGVMSTEDVTGATPASFSAHADSRYTTLEIEASQRDFPGEVLESVSNSYSRKLLLANLDKALNTLSADEDGFFLMYEEAHIDKNCHDNNMDMTFRSVLRFNRAIGKFMEYAFYNPDTLVLITADHETGDLCPEADGVLKYHSDEHSRANVPVFAYGVGAEIFNGEKIENVQIPKTIAAMWGVTDFGDATSGYESLIK